jgi:hypothetical protein
MMKNWFVFILLAVVCAACTDNKEQLRQRATELCQYIPDHELLEQSRDYMTADFYTVLDTMFNHLPEHEAMDHEWLYYFVTSNGGTIADYEVTAVTQTDRMHAVATVLVRQQWEDGSFDESSDVEEHQLAMEKVDGVWLMADFDGHKADCIRHIDINHKEQALRKAMSEYLIKEIGEQYLKGERCIPTLMIAAEEEDGDETRVWGDFWIFWYNVSGDTLKTVSGGNHSGCMTVKRVDSQLTVTNFEQTTDGAGNEASAQRIFGQHYDVFQNMHGNQNVREAVRQEQLREYIRQNGLTLHYYQDFGWDAVEIEK